MGKRRYVFIVTYGRSGSTILQKIIGSAPGFHIAGENKDALLGIYESCRSVAYARSMFGQAPTDKGNPWYGAERLDPMRYASKLVQVFIDEVIMPPSGAAVVGFKEIRYAENPQLLCDYLGFMKQLFEPAQFVFLTRNAEAVASSSWWRNRPKEKVIEKIRVFEAAAKTFRDENQDACCVIGYEDLATDSEKLMQTLAFLGADLSRPAVNEILATRLRH